MHSTFEAPAEGADRRLLRGRCGGCARVHGGGRSTDSGVRLEGCAWRARGGRVCDRGSGRRAESARREQRERHFEREMRARACVRPEPRTLYGRAAAGQIGWTSQRESGVWSACV